MFSLSKKKMLSTLFTKSSIGCGCGGSKSSNIIQPKQKSKFSKNKTSTPITSMKPPSKCPSLNDDQESDPLSNKIETSSTICDAIVVSKYSKDPYQDFQQSMLQMIFENEIHGEDELQELVKCYIQLNSPCHHQTIIKAFKKIWNNVISKSTSSSSFEGHSQKSLSSSSH
ncbi:hypothetical protein Leryth_010694 [Lithospermum erythrorhizon]|nr:hypothetical protein Leryth_010694 [Lithospermum erythrorhizon]